MPDYLGALQTAMATVASMIDFYDPSGVIPSHWKPAIRVGNDVGDSPQPEAPHIQQVPSLFGSGEAPTAPPGLGQKIP